MSMRPLLSLLGIVWYCLVLVRMWICTSIHAGTVLPNIHTKHTGLSQQQRRRCGTVKLQRVERRRQ